MQRYQVLIQGMIELDADNTQEAIKLVKIQLDKQDLEFVPELIKNPEYCLCGGVPLEHTGGLCKDCI